MFLFNEIRVYCREGGVEGEEGEGVEGEDGGGVEGEERGGVYGGVEGEEEGGVDREVGDGLAEKNFLYATFLSKEWTRDPGSSPASAQKLLTYLYI